MNLNAKWKALTLAEKKLGKNFRILELGKEFLDMTKAQTIKIFNKLGLIKICVHLLLRRHSFPFPF